MCVVTSRVGKSGKRVDTLKINKSSEPHHQKHGFVSSKSIGCWVEQTAAISHQPSFETTF